MNEAGPPGENRIASAMRELGIEKKESDRASAMLNVLVSFRKAQRRRDHDPQDRLLEAFFAFAAPRCRDAQGQIFQDLWALYELDDKRDGYFVEFGATNGITMSNSWLLEKRYGWRGIVAEPNPDYHDRLGRERDCIIDHRCVYSRTGEQMTFLCTEKPMYSRLEAINPEDHNEESMRAINRPVTVETISLNGLLDEHGAPDEIDYISVDTEGSEFEILQAFDFERRLIKLFTVEHNFTPMRARTHELMTSKGYVRRFPEYSRFDDWYVHRSLIA